MRYGNVKKVSQDEQQNLTTITNINYIKNFMSVLKTKQSQSHNIVRKTTETKQKTCNSPERIWDQPIIMLDNS